MSQNQAEQCLPFPDLDENFHERPAYQEGCLTDEPDLSIYDPTPPDEDSNNAPPREDTDG